MPTAMVALERERRVGEPALEHAHVPAADDLRVARVRDDRDPAPAEREVALVRLHRGDDHALGQLEELLVERGVQDVRPLDQVDDLVELAARVLPPADRVERGDDLLAAHVGVRLHARLAQRRLVPARGRDLDLARMDPAMPERVRAGRDAVERHVHRGGAQLREQPAHGPREAERPLPVHFIDLVNARPRTICGSRSGSVSAIASPAHVRPHVAVAPLQLLDRDARTAREPLGGLRRLALLVEGDPLGRPALVLIRSALRQVVDDHHQPPRPDVDVVRLGAEHAPRELGQLRRGLAAGKRRQLLAADLEDEPRQLRASSPDDDLEVRLRHPPRERAHAPDVRGPLGDRDRRRARRAG